MGLNKSKKLAKKSIKPVPVAEEVEETEELMEDDDVEEIEEVEEAPVKAKRSRPAKKVERPVRGDEDEDEDDSEDDSEDEGLDFDADSVVKGIVSDKRNLTSAVYQVQLRLPAELEPIYKALTPRLKKALRDAFGELIKKAYEQTH